MARVERVARLNEGVRLGEGRAKSSSFTISTMKDFSIFTVQSLRYLKVAGWTLPRREIEFSV